MDTRFERKGQKFATTGVNLVFPPDLMPPGKYPILENVVAYSDGTVQNRPGLSKIYPTPIADVDIHSIRRLNDEISSSFARIAGAGGHLYLGDGATIAQIDTGYSSSPLSMVPFRPDQSIEPWMYISDLNKLRKVRWDAVNYQMGIAPPLSAPNIAIGPQYLQPIDEMQSGAGWAPGGSAGAITGPSRLSTATTLAAVLFDTSAPGWACVKPTNGSSDYSFFGVGARFNFAAETVTISEIHKAEDTTIAAIKYDSGTTGACTIQPTTPASGASVGLDRDTMVLINAEYVRVLSITLGADGYFSFRCVTTGAHSAGETITGGVSLRVYLLTNHTAGEAVTDTVLQSTITVTPPTTSATGYLTKTLAFNMSSISGRPIGPEDYIHISVKLDNPANLVEGRLLFDVDAATNDFTRNYYYLVFRPNDFTAAAQGAVGSTSAQQFAIQAQIINQSAVAQVLPQNLAPSVVDSNQAFTGNNQWSELIFRVSDLVRVGADSTVNLSNIKTIRFSLLVKATTTFAINSSWVMGTFGPDVPNVTLPLQYRYRYRSSLTGAKSIPGPTNRTGVHPNRAQVIVSVLPSSDPQVDKIDIERFGGVNNEWHYVGTTSNASGNYLDELQGGSITTNPALDIDAYAPFPTPDAPRSGVCNVAGTAVTRVSGDNFNISWARGSEVIIDGKLFTLYAQPASTSFLEVNENVGAKTSVTWEMAEPLLLGQPLQVLFGNFHGFMFGVGDLRRPGYLLYTKGNDPDSAPENYNQEVTSPSEPLMNGQVVDSRAYVFSSERMFGIYPAFETPGIFRVEEVANGKGLFSRWGICSGGGNIYFIAKDGIYRTGGEGFENITDADLFQLFPHAGEAGVQVGPYTPPDMTKPNSLRLAWYDEHVLFTYVDILNQNRCLVYDTRNKAWFPWKFLFGAGSSINLFYGEEGDGIHSLLAAGNDGNIYLSDISLVRDGDADIPCHVQTPAINQGDPRGRKLYGDTVLEANPKGSSLSVIVGFDNFTRQEPMVSLTGVARTFFPPLEINSGKGVNARNQSLDISWVGPGQLFYWEPSHLPKPEDTGQRGTDWDNAGFDGAKFVQGVLLTADTENQFKTLLLQYDGGLNGPLVAVNHNGETPKPYTFTPIIAHDLRWLPQDTVNWRYFKSEWIWEPVPELVPLWETQETTHDLPGWQHARYGYVPYVSNSDGTLTITINGTDYDYPLPNSQGLYKKLFILFRPIKGLFFKYKVSCEPGIRLFKRDLEIYVKAWGSADGYSRVTPFGEISRNSGARI